MRIIILAFITSISLHLLLFINYKTEKNSQINVENKEKTEQKSDIKFVKIKKEEPILEKIVEKQPEQKIEKKTEKIVQIGKPKNEPIKKIVEIPKKVDIQKAKELQKIVLNEQIVDKNSSIQDKTLENFLSQKEPVNKEILNELEKLYGSEYDKFTKIQKAYLEKNIGNFQTITQRVLDRLGYPPLAAKLKIGGVNIVEFMFHPDGSITNLKILDSSGYAVLDEYSINLIEIAYKNYPKPETSTKLRFYVNYRLY